MITPKDIHDKEFKRSLRGYDMDDVDQFLDMIIKDLEMLYKENASLREECDMKTKKVDQYSEMEGSLNRALLLAEKTADNVKTEAMVEKDRILLEAREKAAQILDKAKEDAKAFNSINLDLIDKSDKFKSNLINLFEKQIATIKEFGSISEDIDFKEALQKRVVTEEKSSVVLSSPEEVFIETSKEEIKENFSSDYKEDFDNGLLDEEEEEFKNKVFKFLDK
ncbi:MAG: DivIVA domain-containing protein [Eubacteriales bacterium]|nr:DivIVA domain-containing protein [Eubacteriales bacterium]